MVAEVTGVDRAAIRRRLADLADPSHLPPPGPQRRPGGGRKALTVGGPALPDALLALVEPTTRGDPESPLRRTGKSCAQVAAALPQ